MEIITEFTILKVGNMIYAPKLKKDYILVGYNYNEIYKDMLAYLEPTDKNGNGFQITLRSMITLEYRIH